MLQQTPVNLNYKEEPARSTHRWKAGRVFLAILGLCMMVGAGLWLGLSFSTKPVYAATVSGTINFQARLQLSSGSIAPDGSYNVRFKIYNQSQDGTPLWTETYAVANSQGLASTNGYISAQLGSITPFPSTMNWGQQLYLTMEIGGIDSTPAWDGEMNPRLTLNSVPQAFSLGTYNPDTGYSGSLQVAPMTSGDQSFTVPDQGSAGAYTLLTTQMANANYIQSQSASVQAGSSFWISGNGKSDTAFLAPGFDTSTPGTLSIGTATATAISIGQTGVTTTVNGALALGSVAAADDDTRLCLNSAGQVATCTDNGVSGSGDANYVALFTGTGAIADSILSQSGTALTVTGTFATTSDAAVGGNLSVTGLTTVANLTVNGHLITGGTAPTATLTPNAGDGATVVVTGNDTSGVVTITTGTTDETATLAAGGLVTVNFNTPYDSAPRVMLTGNDGTSVALQAYPTDATTTSFTVSTDQLPAANTTYTLTYFTVQ